MFHFPARFRRLVIRADTTLGDSGMICRSVTATTERARSSTETMPITGRRCKALGDQMRLIPLRQFNRIVPSWYKQALDLTDSDPGRPNDHRQFLLHAKKAY
jgi:hypothetical protein